MEDLIGALGGSLAVTEDLNDTSRPHPRFDQYKARSPCTSQEKRRQERLNHQKQQRQDAASANRDLPADDSQSEDDGGGGRGGSGESCEQVAISSDIVAEQMEGSTEEVSMEIGIIGRKQFKSKWNGKRQCAKDFCNQLMLSEWLVDLPERFASVWMMKVCPVGKRCLVVAEDGHTRAYNRAGQQLASFPSLLPGGGGRKYSRCRDYAVFDCIFVESCRRYYVLDVLQWCGHEMQLTESALRFFWLTSKLSEVDGLTSRSPLNVYPFAEIPAVACDQASLLSALSSAPEFQVDGLLFYHKEAYYETGRTPLLCWLRPTMLADVVGMTPSDAFMKCCMPDESCIRCGEFRQKKDSKMEVSKS